MIFLQGFSCIFLGVGTEDEPLRLSSHYGVSGGNSWGCKATRHRIGEKPAVPSALEDCLVRMWSQVHPGGEGPTLGFFSQGLHRHFLCL